MTPPAVLSAVIVVLIVAFIFAVNSRNYWKKMAANAKGAAIMAGELANSNLNKLTDCDIKLRNERIWRQQDRQLITAKLMAQFKSKFDDLERLQAERNALSLKCDFKSLEMLVRRAETMPQIQMPKGIKIFTDELGNMLFSPGAVGMPKRYFVYIQRPNRVKVWGKQFHVTERPDFAGVPFAKLTFVADEWLTHGEVINKIRAAAYQLHADQAIKFV